MRKAAILALADPKGKTQKKAVIKFEYLSAR
jgi:hypothetical protein